MNAQYVTGDIISLNDHGHGGALSFSRVCPRVALSADQPVLRPAPRSESEMVSRPVFSYLNSSRHLAVSRATRQSAQGNQCPLGGRSWRLARPSWIPAPRTWPELGDLTWLSRRLGTSGKTWLSMLPSVGRERWVLSSGALRVLPRAALLPVTL